MRWQFLVAAIVCLGVSSWATAADMKLDGFRGAESAVANEIRRAPVHVEVEGPAQAQFKGHGHGPVQHGHAGPACCNRQPSCCDNVWKGFCGSRKHWCEHPPAVRLPKFDWGRKSRGCAQCGNHAPAKVSKIGGSSCKGGCGARGISWPKWTGWLDSVGHRCSGFLHGLSLPGRRGCGCRGSKGKVGRVDYSNCGCGSGEWHKGHHVDIAPTPLHDHPIPGTPNPAPSTIQPIPGPAPQLNTEPRPETDQDPADTNAAWRWPRPLRGWAPTALLQ